MSSIKEGVSFHARIYNYFSEPAPNIGSREKTAIDVHVAVKDQEVRSVFDYDGLERPFVLIPRDTPSGTEWDRHLLTYRGGHPASGFHSDQTEDLFDTVVDDVERDAVVREGVAFGMQTNRGDLYFQEPGHNMVPDTD